jgi:D-alanyl-D-alanine carboxypeptidase
MFEPGTMMFYSNTNLVLLGMVVEKVAGAPIQDVLQAQILGPLGLEDTFMPAATTLPRPHARGYTLQEVDGDSPVDASNWSPSWSWTAGGMISNLDDLLVWGEALGTGRGILSPGMQTARLASFDFDVPIYLGPDKDAPQTPAKAYGLGLGLALEWYGHEGELPGFDTYVQHYEPEGITMVVMANTDIYSGADCGKDQPTLPSNPGIGPCMSAVSRIGAALAAALGHPLVKPLF